MTNAASLCDLVCKSGGVRRSFANLEEFTMHNVTRRPFAKLSTTVASIALGLIVTSAGPAASGNEARQAQDDKLQSEFLVDLTLDAQTPQSLGSTRDGRIIVPVSGGTFAGPASKAPSFRPEATGLCSGPTDLASSTFASCCKPMMDKKFTYPGAGLPPRLLVER
jgi:hypothetical protein